MTGAPTARLDGESGGKSLSPLWFYLFLASVVSVAFQVLPSLSLRLGEGDEVVAVAKNLAREGEFANPYQALRTGPTAHVTPIYPLYLAAIFRVLGFSEIGIATVAMVLLAMHVVYPLLLFAAARKLFEYDGAGLTAAGFAIVWPTFPITTECECIFTANLLLICCLLSFPWSRNGRFRLQHAAAAGVISGALALLTATTLMISIPWFAFLYLSSKGRTREAPVAAGLYAAGLLAALAPWVLRNQMSLGAPVLLRSNFGFELALSNNNAAAPTQMQNAFNGTYESLHPNTSEGEAARAAAAGEIAYNRQRLGDALSWIRGHPNRFVELTLKRIFYYWFPYPGEFGFYSFRSWLLTPLACGGLMLLFRRRVRVAWFFAGALLFFPVTFYFIHVSLRLRLPVIWTEGFDRFI